MEVVSFVVFIILVDLLLRLMAGAASTAEPYKRESKKMRVETMMTVTEIQISCTTGV